jgi:thiol-disulfide isomerase/thioredoxin
MVVAARMPARSDHCALLLAATVLVYGCSSPQPSAAATHDAPLTKPADDPPQFVRGSSGAADVATFVANEVQKAQASGHTLLVYVGASWCEPCQHFHQAVTTGQLDGLLHGVRLIEFDSDADKPSLSRAGYSSKLIPLIAVPNRDGTASERRIEGSIKGPDAVQTNLVPRLQTLLERR